MDRMAASSGRAGTWIGRPSTYCVLLLAIGLLATPLQADGTLPGAVVLNSAAKGTYADDPTTPGNEAAYFDCLIDVLKGCMDPLDSVPHAIVDNLFANDCIYVQTAAQMDALPTKVKPGAYATSTGAGHAIVFRVTREWPYPAGWSQPDKDWYKKSTCIHEAWHVYQFYTRLISKFRVNRAGPGGMLRGQTPEQTSAFSEAYAGYVEIEATITQYLFLKNFYEKYANDPARPTAAAHARAIRAAIIYMRSSAERICADGVWDVITDDLEPGDSVLVRLQNCKAQARLWYAAGKAAIASLGTSVEVPDWPEEEEEEEEGEG